MFLLIKFVYMQFWSHTCISMVVQLLSSDFFEKALLHFDEELINS